MVSYESLEARQDKIPYAENHHGHKTKEIEMDMGKFDPFLGFCQTHPDTHDCGQKQIH